MFLLPFLLTLSLCLGLVVTLELNWDLDWVNRKPDGFERPVIGINGQWPLPKLDLQRGERLIVHVKNSLGNETASIHWHGLRQGGSATMDGPSGVNQCPIPPGETFTYDFTVKGNVGTYWYHGHVGGEYMDGLRGSLIIHDPSDPYRHDYDEEYTLTMSDWYHEQAPALLGTYINSKNPQGNEPVPDGVLFNDGQDVKFRMQPGKTYRFRFICMSAFGAILVKFDQHDMTVVEMDGVYTEKKTVKELYVAAAQRYSVLVTAKATAGENYAIVGKLDQSMFSQPSNSPYVHGQLVYDPQKPSPKELTISDADYTITDDLAFVPQDRQKRLPPADRIITLDAVFADDSRGVNTGSFNGISYVPQKVPALYTVLSAPRELVSDPRIYSHYTNPFVITRGQVIDIHVRNLDTGIHPFHLHGHQFQILYRGATGSGYKYDPASFLDVPPRRDTVSQNVGASLVIRYKADDPGVYLFHCHIDWHVAAGLTATIIEDPVQVQQSRLSIPADHQRVCDVQGIPTVGNAVGNTKNWLDLTGERTMSPLPDTGALIVANKSPNPARRFRYKAK